MENHEPSHPPKRLDSWKEIAAHLGRTVRTAQRWESELALPVHRVAGRKRDMVFAYAHELDEWMRDGGAQALAQPPEPDSGEVAIAVESDSPTLAAAGNLNRPNLQTHPLAVDDRTVEAASAVRAEARAPLRVFAWQRRAAAALLLMALGGGAVTLLREPTQRVLAWFAPPAPESYKINGTKIEVYDAGGRFLWSYDFKTELAKDSYAGDYKSWRIPYAGLQDVDGDGRKELLFTVQTAEAGWNSMPFYCLGSNGGLRFKRDRTQSIWFGDQEYLPNFRPRGFLVTPEPDGTKTIWLAMLQTPEFPEVLLKLNHRGEVLGEFWHGGHLHGLAEANYKGKRVMLAGYVENDQRRASLAVLDYDNPTGFAPAQDRYYLCTSCPQGRPLEFFIFPRLELSKASNSMPLVDHIFVSPQGHVQVHVRQTPELPQYDQHETGVQYKLDRDLNFLDAFHDSSIGDFHAQLEQKGMIQHRYTRSEETDLFPVLRWNGSKFVEVDAPAGFVADRRGAGRQPAEHHAAAPPTAPAPTPASARSAGASAPRSTQPQ
jgi:hypothetical protein